MARLTRRGLLAGAAYGVVAPLMPSGGTAAVARLRVRPRGDWAGHLRPKGPLPVENAQDIRFLLVHHSETPNGYGRTRVPGLLRSFYRFHTGPAKRWPDVAYNFVVDAYGGVWEAREGSLTLPVMGSATGGSQGHAMLCCFVGDHASTPPSRAAQQAMVNLLAWLADRYRIDTRPGATTSFISRGSSRFPAGTTVTTPTIAGHRQMSRTTCPGDAAFRLVAGTFPARVTERRGRRDAVGQRFSGT